MPRASTSDEPQYKLRKLFAKNVRLARIHKGLSQEALALKADLDRTFVGTLERGMRNISIDNIELLAKAVGIPAHELLNPKLAQERGFDVTLIRAPRTARLEPVARRKPAKPQR